jgi:GH24 family phage-related lysozyme (muramidase)
MGIPPRCIRLTRCFYNSQELPDDLLEKDLLQAAEVIDILVERPLLDFQREALMCLVADIIGMRASSPTSKFPTSILLKALNTGWFQIATAEFATFCFNGEKVEVRAWRKRACEQTLFSTGKLQLIALDKSKI